jgi:hypothetical protein
VNRWVVEPIVVKMVSKVIVSRENLNWASGELRYPSSSHEKSETTIATTAKS